MRDFGVWGTWRYSQVQPSTLRIPVNLENSYWHLRTLETGWRRPERTGTCELQEEEEKRSSINVVWWLSCSTFFPFHRPPCLSNVFRTWSIDLFCCTLIFLPRLVTFLLVCRLFCRLLMLLYTDITMDVCWLVLPWRLRDDLKTFSAYTDHLEKESMS